MGGFSFLQNSIRKTLRRLRRSVSRRPKAAAKPRKPRPKSQNRTPKKLLPNPFHFFRSRKKSFLFSWLGGPKRSRRSRTIAPTPDIAALPITERAAAALPNPQVSSVPQIGPPSAPSISTFDKGEGDLTPLFLERPTVPAPERSSSDWMKGEILQEMERFIRTQRSAHTQRAYSNDLKQFIAWLRSERYTPGLDALLEYRDYLVKPRDSLGLGLSRTSANRKFATVRSFLGWLQGRGFMRENPAIWVKNFRAKTESPTLGFSDSQVARMLELPNRHTRSGLQHAAILHILFYMGLRRSEICDLKCVHLGQARVKNGLVTTLRVPGKGDKERILPVPPAVLAILTEYMERNELAFGMERPLFRAVKNNVTRRESLVTTALNPNTIAFIVKKYARKAGIDARVSPHSCRATCISNALDQGATHRSVQQMAGWSSPLMIERYDKRQTDLTDSAVNVVAYPTSE